MDIYVSHLFNKHSNNTEQIENYSSLTGCLLFHLDHCKISESFLVYLCTQTLLRYLLYDNCIVTSITPLSFYHSIKREGKNAN